MPLTFDGCQSRRSCWYTWKAHSDAYGTCNLCAAVLPDPTAVVQTVDRPYLSKIRSLLVLLSASINSYACQETCFDLKEITAFIRL